jgi:hypothetical protein
MLGMCNLQMMRRILKIEEGVARKLFATIRYRFSHLDNGFDWETVCGQIGRSEITHKLLTTRLLVTLSGPLWNIGVPVVVAD